MATKSLTFNKIEGITSGSAFTVNAFASDKTVTAIMCFNPLSFPVTITKFTPKIGSVKVGGQNWLSTEIIKITYEMGYVDSSGNFLTYNNSTYNVNTASHQVSEKDGTVPSSVSMSGSVSFYPSGTSNSLFACKMTIESTQNLVGCKVVMSDFQLSIEYTKITCTLTAVCEPSAGGTVTGAGTFDYGSTITLTAIPNSGYKFVKWSHGLTDNPLSFQIGSSATYTAYFELDKINKIYIGTSQPKDIYIGTQKVKAVYVGTTKVYG